MGEPPQARRPRPDRQAGFTLIELMVALTIVGLVTGYALNSLSGALTRLAGNRAAAGAVQVARSTLARVGRDIALDHEADGRAEDGYTWAVRSAPYTAIAPAPKTGVIGYVVHVTVDWHQLGRARRIELSTVRLAYPSPRS